MNIQVIKSRRRTIGIEVHADGKVIVRTPLRISSAEINRFVDEHEDWIRQKLDFVRQKSDNRRGTGAPGIECLSKQELDNIKDTFEKRVQFYCDIIHFLRREMLDFTAFPVFFVSNLLLVQRKKYYFNRATVSRNCSIVL